MRLLIRQVQVRLVILSLLCSFVTACADYSRAPEETLVVPVQASTPVNPAGDSTTPVKVSMLVPLQGDFSKAGQAVRNGYLNAYYQANVSATMGLTIVNSQATTNILSLYQQTLTQNNPAMVVGPLTKADVTALAKESLLSVPVLALNRAEVTTPVPNNFYQFSLDPQADARMVAERLASEGYQQVYVVAPEGDWGQSIAASFGQAWLAQKGSISNSATYKSGQNFTAEAQLLLANHGQINEKVALFLVANATDARVLVPIIRNQPTQLPIYALPVVYSGVPNSAANAVLNGVNFLTTAWQLDSQSAARQSFANLYPDAGEDELRLYGFGMDAYALSRYFLTNHRLEGANIAGYSGQLTVAANGVVNRRLIWATFVGGLSQRLSN